MSQWYYTSNRQQMGPVSKAELAELAKAGLLRTTDLVWQEGMADWVKASSVKDLFPSGISASTAASKKPAKRVEEEKPVPRRRRPAVEEEEEDDDDYRPRRSQRYEDDDEEEEEELPRRRRRAKAQKSSMGIWLLILVGVGVLIGIGLLILIIVLASRESGTRSFNLANSTTTWWHITFKQGHRVDIRVTSVNQSDVDLFVYDPQGAQVAFDDGDSKDCFVSFVPRATQGYKVEVKNMRRIDQPWRNGPNSGKLTFTETPGGQAQAPPAAPPVVQQPPQQPPVQQPPAQPPAGSVIALNGGPIQVDGSLNITDPMDSRLPGRRHKVYTYQMTAGKVYTIDLIAKGNIDPYLRLENPQGTHLAENDDGGEGLNSRLVFTPPQTGLYRIIVTNLRPGLGSYQLKISP
jgi:hypothetical protein